MSAGQLVQREVDRAASVAGGLGLMLAQKKVRRRQVLAGAQVLEEAARGLRAAVTGEEYDSAEQCGTQD